jgi:DNA-binding NarL/FixJ family response regulator
MRENNKPIRIVIVGDHPVVCSGLTSMLSTEPDLKVCASASSGERALALVEHEQFDVMRGLSYVG